MLTIKIKRDLPKDENKKIKSITLGIVNKGTGLAERFLDSSEFEITDSSELTPAEQRIRNTAKSYYDDINELEKTLKLIKDNLLKLQTYCNHSVYEEHPSQVAEDDGYKKCLICGSEF